MLDEHIDIFTLEAVEFAIHQPQVTTVAVATDSPERTESSQTLCHFHVPGYRSTQKEEECIVMLKTPIH